jgi:hypothetical protein
MQSNLHKHETFIPEKFLSRHETFSKPYCRESLMSNVMVHFYDLPEGKGTTLTFEMGAYDYK